MNSNAPDRFGPEIQSAGRVRTLIIGYGNELRQDDGAGPAVARIIGEMNLPGVSVEACHQLLPEHAARISTVELVVFVDATLETAAEISVHRIHRSGRPEWCGHHCDPRKLLHWCHQLASQVPTAWFIHIPAFDLGIGAGMSQQAKHHVRTAVECILRLIDFGRREKIPFHQAAGNEWTDS